MIQFIFVASFLASNAWAQNSTNTTTTAANNSTEPQCPTIDIPNFFYSSDCKFLCRQTLWTDVLVFFLGNYVAHAATVVTKPGQSTLSGVIAIIAALLFPGSGVRNGVDAILSRAKWGETDLLVAARAGAICAVVKVDEDPTLPEPINLEDGTEAGTNDGDEGNPGDPGDQGAVQLATPPPAPSAAPAPLPAPQQAPGLEPAAPAAPAEAEAAPTPTPPVPAVRVLGPLEPNKELPAWRRADVHGYVSLPKGYVLMVVPPRSTFMVDRDISTPEDASGSDGGAVLLRKEAPNSPAISVPTKEKQTTLSCSYNIAKIVISAAQVLFAVATLYRTQGDQTRRYGGFAFGFTTVPYAWMSLVNLLGNAICPRYSTMYVVGSSGLDHLRQRLEDAGEMDRDRFGVAGEVGRLTPETDARLIADYTKFTKITRPLAPGRRGKLQKEVRQGPPWDRFTAYFAQSVAFLPILVMIPVCFALYRVGDREARFPQAMFILLWLVMGPVFAILGSADLAIEGRPFIRGPVKLSGGNCSGLAEVCVLVVFYTIAILLFCTIAIGGYVSVGQMLLDSGVCTAL